MFPQIMNNKKNVYGRIILYAALMSFLIELLQLILHLGLFEFDDVIHNVLGAFIGCLICRFFALKKNMDNISDKVQ